MSRDPRFDRQHLEPILIALAVIDIRHAEDVEEARLSVAANTLLDAIEMYHAAAQASLVPLARLVGDEYVVRLAERAARLTLPEITEWSPATIVALINQLPRISVAVRSAA